MICSAQGARADTKQAFKKMLWTCEEVLNKDPANVDAIWMKGESLHHLAYWESVAPETLKYVDTSSQFDQSLEQFDQASSLSRLKPEIVYGQISTLSSYAFILQQVGKREAAQKQLTRAIALSRQVTNGEPFTLLAIRIYEVNDLAVQSDNSSKSGDQVAALSSLTAASNVLEGLKKLPNSTLDVMQAEVILLNKRGDVLCASGKLNESLRCYESARLKCDEFLAITKADQFIFWSKATAFYSSAKVLKSKGDKQECLKAVDNALAVCEEGLKHNPESAALVTTRDGLIQERERFDN